jgi:predicted RNA binding protein YcfA (HicA-like mRNA interferase family)
VKGRQLLRRLRKLGVEVDERRGKGGHVLLRYRGRQSVLPTHSDTDFGPVLIRRICR